MHRERALENAPEREKSQQNAPVRHRRRGRRRKPVQTGARAWARCPSTSSGATTVPVPGHGAQIGARESTKTLCSDFGPSTVRRQQVWAYVRAK